MNLSLGLMSTALSGALAMSIPGYVPTGAFQHTDLVKNRAWPRAMSQLACSRGSSGTAHTSGGVVVPFGPNVPRITDKGVLREPAGTNYAYLDANRNSEAWSTGGGVNIASVTKSYSAPDGSNNASLIVENTTNAEHYPADMPVTAAVGQFAVFSCYVKAAPSGAARRLFLRSTHAGDGGAVLNLSTGAVVTQGTGVASVGVEPMANGWYRLWACFTAAGSAGSRIFRTQVASDTGAGSYTGDGVSGLLLWGQQVELVTSARGPSSYIPALTSVATRAADILSMPMAISLPFTAVVEWEDVNVIGTSAFLYACDGTSLNLVGVGWGSSATVITHRVAAAGVGAGGASMSMTGGTHRLASRFKAGSGGVAIDGVNGSDSAGVGYPTVPLNTITIGSTPDGSHGCAAYIREFNIYGDRTNAELAALSRLWWLPGVVQSIDGVNGRAWPKSFAQISCSRGTDGWARNSKGIWGKFGPNIIRQNDLGILGEEASTERNRNNTFAGAGPGIPTGFLGSLSITGGTVTYGTPFKVGDEWFWDVTWNGTTTGSTAAVLFTSTSAGATVTPVAFNDPIAIRVRSQLISGNWPAGAALDFAIRQFNGGSLVNQQTDAHFPLGPTMVESVYSLPMNEATANGIQGAFRLGCPAGTTFNNVTVRFGMSGYAMGKLLSAFATATGEQTRAADEIWLPVSIVLPFTAVVLWEDGAAGAAPGCELFSLNTGFSNNRIGVGWNSAGTHIIQRLTNAGSSTGAASVAKGAGRHCAVAVFASGANLMSIDGETAVTNASTAFPSAALARLNINSMPGSGGQSNGVVKHLELVAGAKTAGEIQAMGAARLAA